MTLHHNLPHWNYYRLLERDLEECFRYIEPDVAHFAVYSEQFARIILMACAEAENCMRALAIWEQAPKSKGLLGYRSLITSIFPSFAAMDMYMPRFSIGFAPWQEWADKAAPDWWRNGYNKIKHDRLGHPGAATLGRAVKATAGLQVLLLHYYRRRFGRFGIPAELAPTLILPWDITGQSQLDYRAWDYELPGDRRSAE